MNTMLLKLWISLQNLADREDGQDLVEYALLVCMVALGAISGVRHVSAAVTTVFNNLSSSLA
jgi:pilus assembly protein Flp/PilA